MRIVLGMALLAACVVPQLARAQSGAVPGDRTMAPVAAGSVRGAAIGFASVFRLSGEVDADVGSDPSEIVAGRVYAANASLDFTPFDLAGFRISARLHLYRRAGFRLDADRSFTRSLLAIPRGMGSTGGRNGFRNYTPSLSMSYTKAVGDRSSLGLEAAAVLGRLYSAGSFRSAGIEPDRGGSGLNPVMRLAFRAGF